MEAHTQQAGCQTASPVSIKPSSLSCLIAYNLLEYTVTFTLISLDELTPVYESWSQPADFGQSE